MFQRDGEIFKTINVIIVAGQGIYRSEHIIILRLKIETASV